MNKLNIKKQKHTEPEFDELFKMIDDLKDFLNEDPNPKDKIWNENINTILDFQDDDGSFKLFDSYEIPIDAKVDFCYMPTYLCTAILMKACLTHPESFTLKEKAGLLFGLKKSCVKNLTGHGYESLEGQIEALNIFMEAGLNEFMDLYHDFCPEFSEMIENIISKFQNMESEGKYIGPWGESYETDIKSINEYFCQRLVFVYGTLMRGESNHGYLQNSSCLGKATIEGYDMYDVGHYPAIVAGDSLIIGELYQVPKEDMPSIDMLEGEGSLYAKRCETVTDANGKSTIAFVYVYLGDISNLERIPAWNNDYVWYVSYGSNMLQERFMCYIQGGSFEGSRNHPPCDDATPPVAVRTFDIPYDMYFGNISGSWPGSGVSFLDTTRKGNAFGVAYLITKKQFEHVSARENDGRTPTPGYGWYEDIISIGMVDGFEVMTITNNIIRPYNRPIPKYWNTLFRGIKQNWPEISGEEIDDYLNSCIR